jgi:hypothetical protein
MSSNINEQFLLSLSIIFLGYFLKKVGIFKKEDSEGISRVVLNITLPCLILATIPKISLNSTLLLLPLICISVGFLYLLIGFFLFRPSTGNPKERGLNTMALLGYNIGLFAFPLIEGIFGVEGLQVIAMFDLGNAFVIFGMAFFMGSYFSLMGKEDQKIDSRYILKKLASNIPLIAYIVSISLALTTTSIPTFPLSIIEIIASANRAIVLLMIGITMNIEFDKKYWGAIWKVLLTRYGFGIGIGVALFVFLPFGTFINGIILISLILPIGASIIPYSVLFEFDKDLAGFLVNVTNIISFTLMWIIVSLII